MNTHHILIEDWNYPVYEFPNQLRANIEHIQRWYDQYYLVRHQVVGIGASGATLMGALMSHPDSINRFKCTLLRKPNDNSTRAQYHITFPHLPIIILDDHVSSCNTMAMIAAQLEDYGVRARVKTIIAKNWTSGEHVDKDFEKEKALLHQIFPSAHSWLH